MGRTRQSRRRQARSAWITGASAGDGYSFVIGTLGPVLSSLLSKVPFDVERDSFRYP